MATPGSALSEPDLIQFDKSKQFLDGNASVGIQVSADKDSEVLKALKDNKPFPDRQIELGNLTVNAQIGHDISFLGDRGTVSFSGSASAFAGIGIYKNPSALLQTLNPPDETAPSLNLPTPSGSALLLLRWGFDAQASANGSIALGAGGAATFGVDGHREGLYAAIRCIPQTTGARSQLTDLVQSWILPARINNASQLAPGTWIFSEVDGSYGVKLGAQFGYDFNWVRALPLTGISGDIALRIQLGASVALGFNAQGKYGVVVARESLNPADRQLRLRIFKFSKKGWDFNFNAGAVVTPSTSGLPADYKEFIGAVFGLHSAQFLKDLQLFNKWSDPSNKLPDLFAGVAVDEGLNLLQEVSGVDPRTAFDKAKGFVTNLLNQWDQIDHTVATMIWKLIPEQDALNKIAGIAKSVATATPDSLEKLLEQKLANVSFFETPEGKWLEAAAGGRILSALTGTQAFIDLQKWAKLTASILDDSELQAGLARLKSFIDDALDIKQIESVVNQTTFDSLNDWIKAKLSAFLGAKLDFTALTKIQTAIDKLNKLGQSFYDRAIQALNQQYSFSFAETYQSSTTRTALLDITFDFNSGNPALSSLMQRALDGDFADLFLKSFPGVTVNVGTLTHDLQRHKHIDVTLPHFQLSIDHFNDALAQANVVQQDGQRLLVYDLDAKDVFTVGNRRQSSLTIGAHLALPANTVIRHSSRSLSYSYSYKQATKNMRRAQFQSQLRSYVDTYFPSVFSGGTSGNASGSFSAWVGDLDKLIDQLDPNGTDNFGNTLLSLEVSLPEASVASWINVPSRKDKDANLTRYLEYMSMSRKLQKKLKEIVRLYYFADPEKYKDLDSARTLLAWAAIVPSTSAVLRSDGSVTINTNKDPYWNFPDPQFVNGFLTQPQTIAALSVLLQDAAACLQGTPGLESLAKSYSIDTIQTVVTTAFHSPLLHDLLIAEANLVANAFNAGLELADLRDTTDTDPAEVIARLSKVGEDFTSIFNSAAKTVFSGDMARPLSTALFLEAGTAFDSLQAKSAPVASLGVTVLRQSAAFPPAGFPDGPPPDKKDVVCRQVLLNLAS